MPLSTEYKCPLSLLALRACLNKKDIHEPFMSFKEAGREAV